MSARRYADRSRPHFVYRCYDANDALLYVGCSVAPVVRVRGHIETAWWGSEVERVRHTVFPSRDKALEIERRAIYTERPRCNVRGRWYKRDPRTDWTEQDYRDYRTAIIRTSNGRIGDLATRRLLNDVTSEAFDRFGIEWREAVPA